jgi:hypothetical protein
VLDTHLVFFDDLDFSLTMLPVDCVLCLPFFLIQDLCVYDFLHEPVDHTVSIGVVEQNRIS